MKLSNLYSSSLTLLTDLYQLTMAYGYWKMNLHERPAVFHLFFRKQPFKGQFTIACGLEYVIDFVENFKFTDSDIAYLSTLKGTDNQALFENDFLLYLKNMHFNCDIAAAREGTIVFPHEPLLRVRGSVLQCQLLETALLNIINFQSLIATKAARICRAAKGDTVLEFGLRRSQGIDGGLSASRAAYIGGCSASSNVLAGKLFDIPVKGTHAHSWVMCFDNELEAFAAYADAMPHNCVFLVDTYDTLEGVKNAIKVGKWLRIKGFEMIGIRLDSGDLATLSIQARELLDSEDFKDAAIIASNDLDEYKIKALKQKGALINVWGVGTNLVTAKDQPALGGVYKLGAIQDKKGEWQYKIKLSEQAIKISNPGILQVRRFYNKEKQFVADAIYNELATNFLSKKIVDEKENIHQLEADNQYDNLLKPIFEAGILIYKSPTIHQIREYVIEQFKRFEDVAIQKGNYITGLEYHLFELKQLLIKNSLLK